jgi:hypothetical protein
MFTFALRPRSTDAAIIAAVLGRVAVALVALACTAAAVAAPSPVHNSASSLKAFKRTRHSYDALPAAARALAPRVVNSRRVATAVDTKQRHYYVYVTRMKDKTACVVLIQGTGYSSHCKPEVFLFASGRETISVANGLIGGVAQNAVTKIVLAGSSRRKTIELTPDNGYLWGCPAPTNCAKWVHTVLGYDAEGKLVSTEAV